MTRVDSAILGLAEWFCQKFQLLTGRTNVWLAVQLTNLSIIVYFVWAGLQFLSSDAATRLVIGVFCGGLLYVLTQTIFKVPIETYENAAYQRVANGFRNPRRIRDALLRILFLTLSFALFFPIVLVYVVYPAIQPYIGVHLYIVLLTYSLVLLTTVVLYLLACDPLPPCAGRVWEWLRGLAVWRAIRSGVTDPQQETRIRPRTEASGHRLGVRRTVGEHDAAAFDRINQRPRHVEPHRGTSPTAAQPADLPGGARVYVRRTMNDDRPIERVVVDALVEPVQAE